MQVLIAITGASGIIYAERLLHVLDRTGQCEIAVVTSRYAQMVAALELGRPITIPGSAQVYAFNDLRAPFASGSSAPSAMVIIPCSMGTLGRLAHGVSDNLILRAADVMLKERRPLILVPRETPLNRIHLQNMLTLHDAGALILPACPGFYHQPASIEQLVDAVVARILDHLGIKHDLIPRWGSLPVEE